MLRVAVTISCILHATPWSSANLQFSMDLVKSPYFVDKSDLLESFFLERSGHYNFISCPRSFGKTLNLQMLKTFFNIAVDSTGTVVDPLSTPAYRIIQRLKIYENRDFIRQHFGRHPVILLDLKYAINGPPTEQAVVPWLISRIQQSYLEYDWLYRKIKSDYAVWKVSISEYDLKYFELAIHADLNSTMISDALAVLPKMVYRYFKHSKAIILIDHYDHFQLHVDHISQPVVDHAYRLINEMLLSPFNQTYHHFWYGFGALTSGQKLPNGANSEGRLRNYVFLDDHLFSNHFGYTAEDMEILYARYNCSLEEKSTIKRWYNGYSAWVKRKSFFQPYSVTQYFTNRNSTNALRCYWPKSIPSYNILPFFKVPEFREKIIQLVTFRKSNIFVRKSRFESAHLPRFRSQSLKFDELVETTQLHEIYAYFFENGYLGHTAKQTEFKIPNMELRQYFGKILAHVYRSKGIPIDAVRDLLIRTLRSTNQDPAMIEEQFTVQLQSTFGLARLPKFRTSTKYEYYSILHISALEMKSLLPQVVVNFKAIEGYKGDLLIIENNKVLIVCLRRVRKLEEEKELPAALNYSLPVKGITRVIFVNVQIGDYGDIKTSLRDYGMESADEEDRQAYHDQWRDLNPAARSLPEENTAEQPVQRQRHSGQLKQGDSGQQPDEQMNVQSNEGFDEEHKSRSVASKESNSLFSLPEVE